VIASDIPIKFPAKDEDIYGQAKSLSSHLASLLYFDEAAIRTALKEFGSLALEEIGKVTTKSDLDGEKVIDPAAGRISENIGLFLSMGEKVSALGVNLD
jgi:hypothetical protein